MKKTDLQNAIPSPQVFYPARLKRFLDADPKAKEIEFIELEKKLIEGENNNLKKFISEQYCSGNINGFPDEPDINGISVNNEILRKNAEYLKLLKKKATAEKKQRVPEKFKTFPEYLLTAIESDQVLIADFLKQHFSEAGGRKIGCILQALKKLKKITRYYKSGVKLHEAIRQYYGLTVDCSDTAINNYDRETAWQLKEDKAELEDIIGKINAFLYQSNID
ncbi:MAG: hypothetical protein ACOYNC_07225 [Bacteroidales bacterium]